MRICDNYEAKIWLGLQEGYTNSEEDPRIVESVIEGWCSSKGQCVSITPTKFIYAAKNKNGGQENGLIIGFINYPRYPLSEAEIRNRARELGELLMKRFKQYRVSITFYPSTPNGTMMLENEFLKEE